MYGLKRFSFYKYFSIEQATGINIQTSKPAQNHLSSFGVAAPFSYLFSIILYVTPVKTDRISTFPITLRP